MDQTEAAVAAQSDAASLAVPRQPAITLGPRANRTIARIQDAARQVFLTHGYSGTTVDEIANVAGVSRASFYTYFPTKRDVLIAVGAAAANECAAAIERLSSLSPSLSALESWVHDYFTLLDVHGSFAFAWTQAAHEDDEIRVVGMRGHLNICRRMGERLGELVGTPHPDPRMLGLSVNSILERAWDYARLYSPGIDRGALEAQVARVMWGAIRPVPASVRVRDGGLG
jgi:AcrR family transcriptional regulator